MHGIVRKEAFTIEAILQAPHAVQMIGSIEIAPGSRLFTQFPYHCLLTINIQVDGKGLQYHYQVKNLDHKNLSYGFGLHPFFHLEVDRTYLTVYAKEVMIKKEDYLPTGQLIHVGGTSFDLNKPRLIRNLNLDDVYTSLSEAPQAIISTDQLSIRMTMSEAFSHIVVYTPASGEFFCVEPQTCSTDAINLYNKGEKSASGLLVLKPGESGSGDVWFEFDSYD